MASLSKAEKQFAGYDDEIPWFGLEQEVKPKF